MLVLGNAGLPAIAAQLCVFKALRMLAIVITISLLSVPVRSQEGLLYLRKGPGSAFPVISEISSSENITVIASQTGWVLVRSARFEGWIPAAQLEAGAGRSEAQVWSLSNSERPGPLQIEAGATTASMLVLGISAPVNTDTRIALRYERQNNGEEQVQLWTLGAEKQLSFGEHFRWFGFAGIGTGKANSDSDYWDDDNTEVSSGLTSFSTDLAWRADRLLDIRLRLQYQQAFDAKNGGHPSAALIWNFNL